MNRVWDETMVLADPSALVDLDADAARPLSQETPAGGLHFRELVNLLLRRRRLILTIALCGTMTVFALGLLIPPKYTAKAQIAIDPGGSQAFTLTRDDSIVETHVTTLLSRDHLQRVLDNLLGDQDSAAASLATSKIEFEQATTGAPLRGAAPRWLPGPSELADRLKIWIGRSHNGANETALNLDDFERRLRINQVGRSRIIAVSYTSTAPDIAATVANRVAELYVKGRSERADNSTELAPLDNRIAQLKLDVERSGTAVQAFVKQRPNAAKTDGKARQAEQRLQELEQDAVAKGQLYHTLLRRQRELRDRQATTEPDAYILSLAAMPARPSSANPFLFILPALIVFLISGSLLSVLLERLDRGLRSGREIKEALGIRCIGLVPQVAEADQTLPLHQYLLANPFAAYAEALRSIAATMQLTSPLRRPKVILITSSLPGEGKTTLAASLSVSVALLRQRVLLIDLDCKHPSILRGLGSEGQRDIIDLLLNNCSPVEVIQPVPELGIDYLPMNRRSVYPLILFAGAEMPRLLHELRGGYDCVMINSSPVLGCTETRLLSALADEVIFVVKWGSTRREIAQTALSLLGNLDLSAVHQLRSVRALITQVDLEKHARYGYGDIGEYFLNQEKYSSGSSDAKPAITFRGSDVGSLKRKFVDALAAQYRRAGSTFFGLKARVTHWMSFF
jgi:polysaccharide biosynthesis transport protein